MYSKPSSSRVFMGRSMGLGSPSTTASSQYEIAVEAYLNIGGYALASILLCVF